MPCRGSDHCDRIGWRRAVILGILGIDVGRPKDPRITLVVIQAWNGVDSHRVLHRTYSHSYPQAARA